MTPPPAYGDPDVEALYRDLLFLHALAPEFRDLDLSGVPGYTDFSTDGAMRAVAGAPGDVVGVSARLAVLYDLARARLPGHDDSLGDAYAVLAHSTLALKPDNGAGFVPQDLVEDMNRAAAEGVPFATMRSAQAFEHQETAFIGEDVCTVRRVTVDGRRATWIFSEFETDAPLDGVADWLDPQNWGKWGYLLFRRMDILGAPPAPVSISPPPDGDAHWQGVFFEEVRLFESINTLLDCSHWRDAGAAAMTYDLDKSLDRKLDVDRGFLLVTDTGPTRRVQVLKIVGFTNDVWDSAARLVCPFWTDWIRGAVLGATTSTPRTPTQVPEVDVTACTATVDAWVRFLRSAADPYLDLGTEVSSRVRSRAYSTPDLLADGTRLWSQLAKDWAHAWTYGSETMDEVASLGLDAGLTPPGVPREIGRHAVTGLAAAASTAAAEAGGTVVPVTGIAETDRLVCSELVSIGPPSSRLSATDMTVTVESLGGGTLGARVRTTNASAPHGLYVGRLHRPDGRPLAPVHLYVSRATGA
jgi:hypothetical protein